MSNITKKALANSLIYLLKEKPLNKVSVKDITDNCGLNRMTFYYHFKDIYSLIEWIIKESTNKKLPDNKNKNWDEAIIDIFYLIKNNKAFVLSMLNSVNKEQIDKFIYNNIVDILLKYIEEKYSNLNISEMDKKSIACFYSYGFTGVLLDWISKNMKDKPEEIVGKMSQLLRRSIENAINNCVIG